MNVLQNLFKIHAQVLEQAVVKVKDPAVHNRKAPGGVRLLHGGCLDDVAALLHDIELDKSVVASSLVGNGIELGLVEAVNVTDVAQPGVQQAEVLGRHGCLDTTTAVVAADNNVLDVQVLDGVVDDGHDVDVNVADEVGNVAVDKSLARLKTGDLFGRDARVTAADPEVLGLLASRELLEKGRVFAELLGGPGLIFGKHTVVRLLQVLADVVGGHLGRPGALCRGGVRRSGIGGTRRSGSKVEDRGCQRAAAQVSKEGE